MALDVIGCHWSDIISNAFVPLIFPFCVLLCSYNDIYIYIYIYIYIFFFFFSYCQKILRSNGLFSTILSCYVVGVVLITAISTALLDSVKRIHNRFSAS